MKNSWSVILAFFTLQGCGSGDSVEENLALRVDERSAINLKNSKANKSVWDSQKDLEILVRESCALPRQITEARLAQRAMVGERFEVRVEANPSGVPGPSGNRANTFDEKVGSYPQTGFPIINFSKLSSSGESGSKRESRDEMTSEITLQAFDANSFAKEGVIVEGVRNLNAHMDLVRLLRRDFNMIDQGHISYNLIKAIDKNESSEENILTLTIVGGKLNCKEVRNSVTELKR